MLMVNESDNPKRIAFVVASATGSELQGGKRDVSNVFSILTDPSLGNCHPKQSKMIPECSSKEQFQLEIDAVLNSWNSSNQLIFYFSGHGEIIQQKYCFKFGEQNYHFQLLKTHLEINNVNRAIIILDSCHSGGAINSGTKSKKILKDDDIPSGIALIASSTHKQHSHELKDGSHSVFTYWFCEGIKSGLDNTSTYNGLITIGDIVTYINNKLSQEDYSQFSQDAVYQIGKADQNIWITKNKTKQTKKEFDQEKNRRFDNPIQDSPEKLRFLYEINPPSSYPCFKASIDDLDLKIVKQYSDHEEPGLYESNELTIVLDKLGFYSGITPYKKNLHKAAVLCFHNKPQILYPNAESIFTVVKSKGTTTLSEVKYIKGPLIEQFTKLLKYVDDNKSFQYIGSDGKRRDVININMEIVREIISNAITHRDYEAPGPVKVTVTEEAVEVCSPGGFPNNRSWDEWIKASSLNSEPRDATIASYLRVLTAVEKLCRGFYTFRTYINRNGKNSLTCREDCGSICVRLLRPQPSQEEIQGNDSSILENSWDSTIA